MGVNSEESIETPPLPRLKPRTLRAGASRLLPLQSDEEHEYETFGLLSSSVSVQRGKRRGSFDSQVTSSLDTTQNISDTYEFSSKRPKTTEESKQTKPKDKSQSKGRLILDCVELVSERRHISNNPRSEIEPKPKAEPKLDIKGVEKKRPLSASVSRSPSPTLIQPFETDDVLKMPERLISGLVDRSNSLEKITGDRKLSRRQKKVITLDSQDSDSDSSCELEEERIQYLNVFCDHEEALFHADTFQSFMECKSQLARKQRIYNSSPCSRIDDELGRIIGAYAARSLEKISYFEDQIILLRMDLVQHLKTLVHEREESLHRALSSRNQLYTSLNSLTNSPESSWEITNTEVVGPFQPDEEESLSGCCSPNVGNRLDDSGADVALRNDDKVTMVRADSFPLQLKNIAEPGSQGRMRETIIAPAFVGEHEGPLRTYNEAESTSIITTPPLPSNLTDNANEDMNSLEHKDSLHDRFHPVDQSPSQASPIVPLSSSTLKNSCELIDSSNPIDKSPSIAEVTLYDSNIQVLSYPPPLTNSLDGDHSNPCERPLKSPTSLQHFDTNEDKVKIGSPEDCSNEAETPIGMHLPSNDAQFDKCSKREVLSRRSHSPQVQFNDNQHWNEHSSDQEMNVDEVNLLELNPPDLELPTTLYYIPSSPSVASDSSFTHKKDTSFNPDTCTFESTVSESQPFLLLSDLPNSTSKMAEPQTTTELMPNYRSLSFEALKELGKKYNLEATSQEVFASLLEQRWKMHNPVSFRSNTLDTSQPTQSSSASDANYSKQASPAASISDTDTEDREIEVVSQDWDITESDDTEIGGPDDTDLEDTFFKFIKNDTELYNSILCYKPVDFGKLYRDLTQAGLVFKQRKLRDFLDNQGILAIFTKERWGADNNHP